jgi:hypothetical protein
VSVSEAEGRPFESGRARQDISHDQQVRADFWSRTIHGMDKKHTLMNATFGSRVAEDETEGLHSYFVETEQWRKLLAGDVDIVFGSKGAGKSALYSLLVAQKETLRVGRRIVILAAENPRGTPAFRDLTMGAPASEEEFRVLWKLYFLTLLANYIRHHLSSSGTSNANAAHVIDILSENGLLAPNVTLISRLKAVLNYVRNHMPAVEGALVDPNTGIKLTGRITLGEPTSEQRANGFLSTDDLLHIISTAYRETAITAWLVLDRLDVAFSDSVALEGIALRSLFRTYLDMSSLSNVQIKIFLRDDIWRKIVGAGFREASHVTRTLTISWDPKSLLNLIVRRLVHNTDICSFYGVTQGAVLENAGLQDQFFDRVFPKQIDVGTRQPSTLDWMLSRTADGSKRTEPRELLHLLIGTRDEQLRLYELGGSEPPGENLFDRAAIRQALPAVSKARYEQTLCAEHPTLKRYLDKLERENTQQTPESLSKLWGCSLEAAAARAEQLAEVGFFERKGAKESPAYWVPFLYRDALNLVQGSA